MRTTREQLFPSNSMIHRLTLTIFLGCTAVALAGAIPSAVHLRCDSRHDPLGVDAPHPSLGWQVDGGAKRAVRQTACHRFPHNFNSYKSGYVGKWHLGDPGWYPEDQGYDVNIGGCFFGQPPGFFDPYNEPTSKHESLRKGIYNLPGRKPGEYLTHREADEAESLIRKWHAEKQPFFLAVNHYAVHTPIQAIEEVADKYMREDKNRQNARYAAMVEAVDDSTRQIVATLKELGIEKNTLIIFTSDNGGLDSNGNPTDNAPLRSGKGFPYEGGIRVPFLVRWPGVIPEGKLSDTPISSIDIFPTILEAVGVRLPKDRVIDGLSLLDHLKSGGKVGVDRNELLWHFPHHRYDDVKPYSIIRKGDWKLIKYWTGGYELFDLSKDLSEERNLAAEMPGKAGELDAILMKRLAEGNAKLPRKNPNYVSEDQRKSAQK